MAVVVLLSRMSRDCNNSDLRFLHTCRTRLTRDCALADIGVDDHRRKHIHLSDTRRVTIENKSPSDYLLVRTFNMPFCLPVFRLLRNRGCCC